MRQGQTVLEYMILLGIAVMVIFYMGPAFKRGLQSLIKVTADQIGNQAEADQDVKRRVNTETGRVIISEDGENDAFLVESKSAQITSGSKVVKDGMYDGNNDIYTTTVEVNEVTDSATRSVTDMGFTKD